MLVALLAPHVSNVASPPVLEIAYQELAQSVSAEEAKMHEALSESS
tara:strand:+ start:238 stop:375 length:138 start_codon:yes stop_codon:yes gene_type:complete